MSLVGGSWCATFIHKSMNGVMHLVILLEPPLPEEGRLHVNKPPARVVQQCIHHRVQNVLDSRPLNVTPRAIVVLVDGLEPAHVIMRMRNDVHINQAGLALRTGLRTKANTRPYRLRFSV